MYITLQCTVSYSVQYPTVYITLQCTVPYSVQYPIVYITLQCTVSYSVQYPTVYSILQCTVPYSVQYPIVYSIQHYSWAPMAKKTSIGWFPGFPSFRKMGRGTDFWPMDRYHRLNMNRWIDGHRSDQDFVIDERYYRSKGKILNRWIDTIGGQHDQKYRSIVSIDSIGIDPSIHRR